MLDNFWSHRGRAPCRDTTGCQNLPRRSHHPPAPGGRRLRRYLRGSARHPISVDHPCSHPEIGGKLTFPAHLDRIPRPLATLPEAPACLLGDVDAAARAVTGAVGLLARTVAAGSTRCQHAPVQQLHPDDAHKEGWRGRTGGPETHQIMRGACSFGCRSWASWQRSHAYTRAQQPKLDPGVSASRSGRARVGRGTSRGGIVSRDGALRRGHGHESVGAGVERGAGRSHARDGREGG